MFIDLVIVGPTASGKSRLALTLAKQMDAEIVSADSRQIYKEISIGTGKLRPDEQEGIPHHLMDMYSISDQFSAGEFVRKAQEAIRTITNRKKKVILCGGTGLYLESLLSGIVALPSRSPGHYESYRQDAAHLSTQALYSRLESIDPPRAQQIHPNDRFRVLRSLYLFDEFSLPPSEIFKQFKEGGVAYGGIVGLDPGRAALHQQIHIRISQMIQHGWIEEVDGLLREGRSPSEPGFNSLGYREVIAYLDGKISRESLPAVIELKTRQYAKRQRTWFRHMAGIRWINPEKDSPFPLELLPKYGTIGKISC